MVAELVVLLALGRLELAIDGLFHFLRQVAGDLCLGPAQDKWPERPGQQRTTFGIRIAGGDAAEAEDGGTSQHARVQEFEQAPQLTEMIFDRCAAQRQPVPALQETHRLRRFRVGILDGLGLVENAIVEEHILEEQGVAAQRAIGGEDDVVVLEMVAAALTANAAMVEYTQLRREAGGLLFPVKDQRARGNNQRRLEASARTLAVGLAVSAKLPARVEQGQHLYRLTQPHVIGEAAAEPEPLQKVQPAEPILLVAA